jgi:hypothetical protein
MPQKIMKSIVHIFGPASAFGDHVLMYINIHEAIAPLSDQRFRGASGKSPLHM